VTAGAFEAGGQLAGFVFGMTGVRDGELAHWSDLLAVRADARDRGLGRLLKLFQRELLLPLGVRTMYWTFDPLVSKNAHLNLNRLGARPRDYVVDMYGRQTGSALHGGTGTDRFIVAWDLIAGLPDEGTLPAWVTPGRGASGARGARRGHRGRAGQMPPAAKGAELEAPIVNAPDETGWPRAMAFPDAAIVRVEIPADIHALQHDRMDLARAWRMATRRALRTYLERGYTIDALRRGTGPGDAADRRWYVLTHPRV
jgi:predicted GNAT superfamily acetyltransferase